MSLTDRLLTSAAPPASTAGAEFRAEVIEAARASARGGGWARKFGEIVALVDLRLRIRCRSASGDDDRTIWSAGIFLGGLALAAVLVLESGAAAVAAQRPGTSAGATFLAVVVGFVLAARGARLAAVVALAAGGSLYVGMMMEAGGGLAAPVTLVAMTLTALTRPEGAREVNWRSIAVGPAAVVVAIIGLTPTIAFALTAIVPIGLLVAGLADARLAVAALVLWLWRLVAFDLGELTGAAELLARNFTVDQLLIRWTLMVVGVVFAWHMAQRSVARAVSL